VKIKRNFEKKQFLNMNKTLCRIYQFGSISEPGSVINELYTISLRSFMKGIDKFKSLSYNEKGVI